MNPDRLILALLFIAFSCFAQTPQEISDLINKKKSCAGILAVVLSRAQAGDPVGERQLGGIYYSGCDVPKNVALGIKWYTAAAQQNEPLAERILGRIYIKGEGVNVDVP